MIAVGVLALAAAVALPAAAQTDTGLTPINELSDGPWVGWMTASGADSRSAGGGVVVSVLISSSGEFEFAVEAGTVSGTWSTHGSNNWEGVETGGPDVTVTGSSTLSSDGALAGDRTTLTATGTTRQLGELTISFPTGEVTRDINEVTDLSFTMRVVESNCEWAHGDLSASFLEGTFTAIRTDLLADLSIEEAAAQVKGLTEWMDRFNALIDTLVMPGAVEVGGTFEVLDEVLDDAESILNNLNNLSECDTRLIGQDSVERFRNMITGGVADVTRYVAERYNLSVGQVRTLLNAALRVGAIGSGATNAAAAAVAEEALRARLEVILNQNVDTEEDCPSGQGSCLVGTSEVLEALYIGDTMGWTFEIAGATRDPGTYLERYAAAGVTLPADGDE